MPEGRSAATRRGRLSRSADFDAIHQLGRSAASRHVTVRYRRRDDGSEPRVGYAVPRRLGDAVDRNAIKRRLREAVRANDDALAAGTDYVLVARPGLGAAAEAQGFDWLVGEVRGLLEAAAAS
jgi:ribonuclease P protein component